ncbi:hypothetical protein MP638_002371 [Amoeboaphelidium occidentale]|nr:hypothetical protein MP638_002371 [Amoeboaphelidium occidentale]
MLDELEKLAIVARICTNLENHYGIKGQDAKDVAEFILDIFLSRSNSEDDFVKALVDTEFSKDFIIDLYRLISQLMPQDNEEGDAEDNVNGHSDDGAAKFPGLALPNNTKARDLIIKDEVTNTNAPPLRKRRMSPEMDRSSSRPSIDDDAEPVSGKVYSGIVMNIRDFGVFVRLQGLKGDRDGLVHVSQLRNGARVSHPEDIVSRRQKVYVKVVKYENGKINLSMRDVDQETGQDLNRTASRKSFIDDGEGLGLEPARPSFVRPAKNKRKRLTSPELWELKQLVASGVMDPAEYAAIQEQNRLGDDGDEEADEDLDIELNKDEPLFLKGQTSKTLELSPVRVVKVPDGSLNRAAITGASLARERKDMKRQLEDEKDPNLAKEVGKNWNDPLAADKRLVGDVKASQKVQSDYSEWKQKLAESNPTYGKRTTMSIREQRESLPIYKLRHALMNAIAENQVLVVIGDTGSGKTTQLTQYLAEEGYVTKGIIGCTQPRRVAAMSVAKRVSEEVGCQVGQEVGYTIRFEDHTSPSTKIKYMTDGMLLRECLVDGDMRRYSVIILDEAHERTIDTDVLFGLLKETLKRRKDLKLIVTSATLDAEKFAKYFYGCPIFTIPGRTFPVEILYTKEPESDYLEATLEAVTQIHLHEPPGDILVFLTGQEEIDSACEMLYSRMKSLGSAAPDLIILPIYSALPSEIQSKIFEPTPEGKRKCVIATNIAETSVTIDGIYYVVDPGFVKQSCYDPKLGMDSLLVVPISQAQARQRAGRAGRTGPGKCYRLYTEQAYHNEMLPSNLPDIQRTNLANTVLTLKAMGINDLLHFDFMDPPPVQSLITAMEILYSLSALDEEGFLTRIGRKMAEFPLDPPLGKMLIASVDLGCSEEILTVVAMLSGATNIWYRPKGKQEEANKKKKRFDQPEGDHLTLLTIYNSWKNAGCSKQWCFDNFIQDRSLRRAEDVRKQLLAIMDRYKIELVSCGRNYSQVRKAICAGFFRHAARRDKQEGYRTIAEGTNVFMHPSSALYQQTPEWVVYHELVMTSREFMREVTVVDPKWLKEVAPTFFKVVDPSLELSKRKKAEVIKPLYNRFDQKEEWRISKLKAPVNQSQVFSSNIKSYY